MLNVHFPKQVRTTWGYFLRPLEIFKNYKKENLRPDLIAGLTIAVILIPQAIAFAYIAELPPQFGLYSAVIGSIVGALWGSSSQLQTGPSNTTSLLVLSILLGVASSGSPDYLIAAGLLTVMVGFFRLAMGLARLGILVNFISDSVIVGFTAGAGLLIFFNQLRNLFRLDIPSTPMLTETLSHLGLNLFNTHLPSLFLGIITIIIILVAQRLQPKFPAALFAILVTSILVVFFHLESLDIRIIGSLPKGFPPFTRLPIMDLKAISSLVTGALAIAAIGLVEAISIARSIASQTGQRLDSDQEFIGQGLANIACGFFSGYTCSGSFTRSAVNFQAGAKTALSNVFCGLFVFFIILVFGSLAAFIPLPTLAAVVLIVAFRLIDLKEIKRIWFSKRGDRVIMVATLLSTLFLPLTFAVLTGILISLAYYLLKTSTPRVRVIVPDESFLFLEPHQDKPQCPQLGIIEIMGDLYFGAVRHVEECILENQESNPSQRFLLLRMVGVEQIDISGVHILEGITRKYREQAGDIFISRYQGPVIETLHDSGFSITLGEDHFLRRDLDAIGYLFYHIIDPAICVYECPYRVFYECQNIPKRLDLIGEIPRTGIRESLLKYIEPKAIWEKIHQEPKPTIIDVREPREFRKGHIPGAFSIPLPDLLANHDLMPSKGEVIFVCQGGRRSSRAAYMLRDNGKDRIFVLRGGMVSWEAENLLEAIDKD